MVKEAKMRTLKVLLTAAVAVVVAGGSVSAQGADRVRFDIEEANASGISAIAFMTRADDSTIVEAQLNALPATSPSGAVYMGTCAAPGDPVELLGFVDGVGISSTARSGARSKPWQMALMCLCCMRPAWTRPPSHAGRFPDSM